MIYFDIHIIYMCVCVCMFVCVYIYVLFFLSFWPCCVTCGILVPQPGSRLIPPAVEVQSGNHWAAGEVPIYFNFYMSACI